MKVSFNRLALAGLVVLAGVGVLGSQALSGPAQGKAADPPLRVLLLQKRALVAGIAKDRETQYKAGVATSEQVEQAAIAVIQTDLELATTQRERITLREKWVEIVGRIEERAETRYKAAAITQTEWQQAKLARLEAEIALEREKK